MTDPVDELPRSVARGILHLFPEHVVECHVLDDERRVCDTTQIQPLLGAAKDRNFWRMITRIPSLSKDLRVLPRIAFVSPNGGVAFGYDADFIMEVCLAYQRDFLANRLHHKQIQIARQAMVIVAACAKLGLESLIDEATGYQKIRPSDFQRRRYDLFLRRERAKWEERWDEDLVRSVCRLYGKPHTPQHYPTWMRGIVGRVYDLMFGWSVMHPLRRRNPEPSKGTNHHQYFRAPVQVSLKRELTVVQAFAETSPNKADFWARMRTRYRGDPLQTNLWS